MMMTMTFCACCCLMIVRWLGRKEQLGPMTPWVHPSKKKSSLGAICCIRSILQEWAIFKAQNFLHVTPGSTWLNQMRRHQHRRHPCQLAPCPLVRTLLTQTTMINSIGETPVPQHPCVLKSRQRQLPWQTDLPIGWNHPTCYFWFLRLVLILVILQMLLNPNWQYPTCVVFFWLN